MSARRISATDAVDLGEGWLQYLDDTRRPYYLNQVTEEVTWDHPFPESGDRRISQQPTPPLPEEDIFDDDGGGGGAAAVDCSISLPPGWSEWTDSTGAMYYTHDDGTSTWTRPGTNDSQQHQQASPLSLEKGMSMQTLESSLHTAQTSSSITSMPSPRPECDSQSAFGPQSTPPPAPLPSKPMSHPAPQVLPSAKNSWSAESGAHVEALLQSFPAVLSRLRASFKTNVFTSSGSQPLSFAWYTLGMNAKLPTSSQFQPMHLDADVLDMGAPLYYQSKGGLFKKPRTVEQRLSHEAVLSSKPALEASKVAGESVVVLCRRCCVLVMIYMGDYQLDHSYKDRDLFKDKDNAINAASGSSRLVLIIREIFDIMRSSVQLADEAYARVLKQLCSNYCASSAEAGWSLLLLMCSYVGCSDTMMRFLMIILNKCVVVERDMIARSVPNPWYAAHVVMLALVHRSAAHTNGSTLSPFVDAEVENSFRKMRHLSPLYSFIEEILQLEQMFRPMHFECDILNFLPRTLVVLTDLIYTRGGFQTDGIFRLAGERSCVTRVRASISCRFPIVEADSDPLVLAEVSSQMSAAKRQLPCTNSHVFCLSSSFRFSSSGFARCLTQ